MIITNALIAAAIVLLAAVVVWNATEITRRM